MGKYIKLFNNHAEYTAFTQTDDFIKPNVSHCVQQNEVHYNPWTDPRLIVKYNVTDASQSTQLYGYYAEEGQEDYWVTGAGMFDKVEIDGTEVSIAGLDTAEGKYDFTAGEHTVKYTLKDPTSIGNGAFGECPNITSVSIPDSVTEIGGSAFSDCTSLTDITIPNIVTSIGISAFAGCTGLTSVVIPDTVTNIGNDAFYGCTNVISVTLPNTIVSITDEMLCNCTSLQSITIPNSVTSIGFQSFARCTGLTGVTIPSGVTNIGQAAFSGCTGLDSITCLAVTPPAMYRSFIATNNCPIYVPNGSVAAYQAASGWSTYSSRIQAIPNA